MTASASEPGDAATAWAAPAGWLKTTGCRLSAYLPLEGFVGGRRVLDVFGLPASQDRLRRAGARAVMGVAEPPWQVPDGSVDVVFALGAWASVDEAVLAEVKRVLAPDGFIAWRFELTPQSSRGALAARLSTVFSNVEMVGQVPIVGFTFDRGGSGNVVVAEDHFPSAAPPSHVLCLASRGAQRPWAALESWVVPLHRPDVADTTAEERAGDRADRADKQALQSRLTELSHEREYLREALMTLQDERERLQRLAANLRRDADRSLARLSEQAAALEVLTLERDHALRRLAAGDPGQPTERAPTPAEELRKTPITSA